MKIRMCLLVLCLIGLTGCVKICGRTGPGDCRGFTDCYYTSRAFAKCDPNNPPTAPCNKPRPMCCVRR